MQVEKQEGELQKRLKQFEAGRSYPPCTGKLMRKDDFIDLILDEMWQDFPDHHDPTGKGNIYTNFEMRVLDWLKKWKGII